MSNLCDGASWKERVESLSIDAIIEDDRAFKSMLGIGEDAYDTTKLLKIVDNSLVNVIAGIGGGAVASSSVLRVRFSRLEGFWGCWDWEQLSRLSVGSLSVRRRRGWASRA